MSPSPATGEVSFVDVTKRYRLGQRRVALAAAWPFGDGTGRGESILALDRVSLRIEPGAAFALVGSNGAGKSTALKCLAGVVSPSSGQVSVGGRIVSLIELGIGFHPDLSGYENVRFAAAVAGVRGRAVRDVVDKAVAFAELDRFMSTPVKRYSSGMYARLSFGIAASLPADVLIVDEILAVGDVAFQRKCYAHLAELRHQHGVTLVFVSHNEWVLKETCDQGVLLRAGRVAATGDIELLLNAHAAASRDDVANGPERRTGAAERLRLVDVKLGRGDGRRLGVLDDIVVDVSVEIRPGATSPVVGVAYNDEELRLVWGAYSDQAGVALVPGLNSVRIEVPHGAVSPGMSSVQVFAFDRASPVIEDVRRLDLHVEAPMEHRLENGIVSVRSSWSVLTPGG